MHLEDERHNACFGVLCVTIDGEGNVLKSNGSRGAGVYCTFASTVCGAGRLLKQTSNAIL